MTIANVLFSMGFVSIILVLHRIFLVLAQEFPDEDDFVKDPIAYAVVSSIDFDTFKENNWKGFEALWAAIQFRTFYKQFTPLISPRDAKILALVMLGLFITVVVVAQIAKVDQEVNTIIGAVATTMSLFWWVVIEHCKMLKKSVDKLRVVVK